MPPHRNGNPDVWSSGTPGDIDRHVHYTWGARYIDDIAFRRIDTDGNGDYTDGGDKTYYHITDAQFSTRAVLDSSAALVEWVDYTPYGEARHHHKFDIDGDGDFDASDRSIVTTLADLAGFPPDPTDIDELGYRAEADINRDGSIDGGDATAIGTSYTSAVTSGLLSTPGGECDNIIGYDGYVFNQESMQYCVRYRTYEPELGRWIERDPITYAYSLNQYGYALDSPNSYLDPSGLIVFFFRPSPSILDPVVRPLSRPMVDPQIQPTGIQPMSPELSPPLPFLLRPGGPMPEKQPHRVLRPEATTSPEPPLSDPSRTLEPYPTVPEDFTGNPKSPIPRECQFMHRQYKRLEQRLAGVKCNELDCDELARIIRNIERLHGLRIHTKKCYQKHNLPTNDGHDIQIKNVHNRYKNCYQMWVDKCTKIEYRRCVNPWDPA